MRAGHTEAAVDIARLAGLNPSGVICEIMKEDGEMARLPDLIDFAKTHGLKIGTISDLIAYRHKHDNLITETGRERVTSSHGGDVGHAHLRRPDHRDRARRADQGRRHRRPPVLVRAHALNALEDVLGIGLRQDGPTGKLPRAMEIIAREGRGAVFLFRQPRPSWRARWRR